MFFLLMLGVGVAAGLIHARSKNPAEEKLLNDNWTYITQSVPPSVRYFLLRLNDGKRAHVEANLSDVMREMKKDVMTEITQPGFYFVYDHLSPVPLASRRVQ